MSGDNSQPMGKYFHVYVFLTHFSYVYYSDLYVFNHAEHLLKFGLST